MTKLYLLSTPNNKYSILPLLDHELVGLELYNYFKDLAEDLSPNPDWRTNFDIELNATITLIKTLKHLIEHDTTSEYHLLYEPTYKTALNWEYHIQSIKKEYLSMSL